MSLSLLSYYVSNWSDLLPHIVDDKLVLSDSIPFTKKLHFVIDFCNIWVDFLQNREPQAGWNSAHITGSVALLYGGAHRDGFKRELEIPFKRSQGDSGAESHVKLKVTVIKDLFFKEGCK